MLSIIYSGHFLRAWALILTSGLLVTIPRCESETSAPDNSMPSSAAAALVMPLENSGFARPGGPGQPAQGWQLQFWRAPKPRLNLAELKDATDGKALHMAFDGKGEIECGGFGLSQKLPAFDPAMSIRITLRYKATAPVPLRAVISARPGCYPPWVGKEPLALEADGQWHEISVLRDVHVFRPDNRLLKNGESYLELTVIGKMHAPAELCIDWVRAESVTTDEERAQAEVAARLNAGETAAMEKAASASPLRGIAVYPVRAVTNRRILPDTAVLPGASGVAEISMTAARNQTESASFVLRAGKPVAGVELIPGDLKTADGATISASALDLRVVKAWWQDMGQDWSEETPAKTYNTYSLTGIRVLTPELLVKDDTLINTDDAAQENLVKVIRNGEPRYINISKPEGVPGNTIREFPVADATALQPVSLDAGKNKQFWLDATVARNCKPGVYAGAIAVRAGNEDVGSIPVSLTVLPLTLPDTSHNVSSIYYRNPSPQYYGEKVWEQFGKEIRDMVRHGVVSPMVGFSFSIGSGLLVVVDPEPPHGIKLKVPDLFPGPDIDQAMPSFRKTLQIMAQNGVDRSALYLDALPVKSPSAPDQLALLEKRVRAVVAAAKEAGFGTVYFYGIDEADGARLKSQFPAWEAVHRAGGKMFVADGQFPGQFEEVGERLDLSVRSGYPDRAEAAKWHGAGRQIAMYNNPQSGGEQPDTFRRNYGLLLWQYGYDGAMTYIYHNATIQNTKGIPANPSIVSWASSWNDFCTNPDTGKQMMMVYPTADGVIDTLQWEGYRTGLDDVRYIRALETVLASLPEEKASCPQAAEARAFLAPLKAGDINLDKADPQTIRQRAAELTAALASPESQAPDK